MVYVPEADLLQLGLEEPTDAPPEKKTQWLPALDEYEDVAEVPIPNLMAVFGGLENVPDFTILKYEFRSMLRWAWEPRTGAAVSSVVPARTPARGNSLYCALANCFQERIDAGYIPVPLGTLGIPSAYDPSSLRLRVLDYMNRYPEHMDFLDVGGPAGLESIYNNADQEWMGYEAWQSMPDRMQELRYIISVLPHMYDGDSHVLPSDAELWAAANAFQVVIVRITSTTPLDDSETLEKIRRLNERKPLKDFPNNPDGQLYREEFANAYTDAVFFPANPVPGGTWTPLPIDEAKRLPLVFVHLTYESLHTKGVRNGLAFLDRPHYESIHGERWFRQQEKRGNLELAEREKTNHYETIPGFPLFANKSRQNTAPPPEKWEQDFVDELDESYIHDVGVDPDEAPLMDVELQLQAMKEYEKQVQRVIRETRRAAQGGRSDAGIRLEPRQPEKKEVPQLSNTEGKKKKKPPEKNDDSSDEEEEKRKQARVDYEEWLKRRMDAQRAMHPSMGPSGSGSGSGSGGGGGGDDAPPSSGKARMPTDLGCFKPWYEQRLNGFIPFLPISRCRETGKHVAFLRIRPSVSEA